MPTINYLALEVFMDGESTNKDRLVSDLRALVNDAEELLARDRQPGGRKD